MSDGSSKIHLLRPKLEATLREGYGWAALRKDALAGATVAIVALPLSMAIGVASGVAPERGLYAAIVGGFLVSLLSGSRYQIGGPAGAFIVLVASTVASVGIDGLLLTVFLSGAMLTVMGLLRLGSLIRLIPHAVTVGFTSGVALIIAASQLKDWAGLTLAGPEPGSLIPKLLALGGAIGTVDPATLMVGLGTSLLILAIRRLRPYWPGMLIAVVLASALVAALRLPVATIGSRFGGLPHGLLMPHLPAFDPARIVQVLPIALSFTVLGGIESLLSARVADAMTGRKHRSNMELIAQGLANMGSAVFGGISVTGTIARTATNVRAGGVSPVSGILHAVFLLLFVVIAAPLAAYIPLSALSGLLLVVAWNMAERHEFLRLMRHRNTALVLAATFGFTVARDLTAGIVAGCALAALLALAN